MAEDDDNDKQIDAEKGDAAADAVNTAEVADDAGDGNDDGNTDDKKTHMKVAADAPWKDRMWEGTLVIFLAWILATHCHLSRVIFRPAVFSTFWPLGLVAFGGPQAHVAILRDHLVVQRDWLDEEQFTELFAIGQVRRGRVQMFPVL